MKQLVCALLLLSGTSSLAQTSGQSFYRRYEAALKQKFGGLASEADLRFLLGHIIDRKHLEVDYNHYFRPSPAPLAHLVANRKTGASVNQIKNALLYPLLRFVLPISTPRPVVNAHSSLGDLVAAQAYSYLGVPYGPSSYNRQTGQGSLDCSGLVRYVFDDVRANLRNNNSVISMVDSPDLKAVSGEPKPGDLLVRKHKNNRWSHVGIYVGNQQLIEAPYIGTVVRVTPYKPAKWHGTLRYVRQ